MGKRLERDLGLPAVVAISIGAMVGSGIFVLPALAVGIVGPGVVLAYVLAGLLVLPAALSQSELATAMPEAGGSYLYIERGMGPLAGTVAGLGSWFTLVFKSGLALVGGVPYLVLVVDLPPELLTPVALALGALLTVVNLVGAKQTGRLQVAIVVVMLLALGWFALGGTSSVDTARFEPLVEGGWTGLLAATGLVFVSYAGVLKVASVAEEVERPDRNIPLGILGSLVFTTALYALIVFVIVGVVPTDDLAGSLTPMADAAQETLGTAGVVAVVLAALLALVSTANAGVLSASRYPFAMARDSLVPQSFAHVSDRFSTPSTAITATGVVTLVLVAFVPILDIAKLASAFQILVFVLVNVAVVVFREGNADYEPTFHSPLYPWVQVAGVGGGLLVLTQMGTLPLVGAALIVVLAAAWYVAYARPRVDREGVALATARDRLGERAVSETAAAIDEETGRVLVATTPETSERRERELLALAADLAGARPADTGVSVVLFEEVPDQLPLDYAAETRSPADVRFEEWTELLVADATVPVRFGEVVSHDSTHAVANYARHHESALFVLDGPGFGDADRLDWIARHAPCDVVVPKGGRYDDRPVAGVMALTTDATADPAVVAVADAVANAQGTTVALRSATTPRRDADRTRTYHRELAAVCTAPIRTVPVRPDGGAPPGDGLVVRAAGVDRRRPGDPDAGRRLSVSPHGGRRPALARRVLERLLG